MTNQLSAYFAIMKPVLPQVCTRVGVKYSTCTWYLYLSTYFQYLMYLSTWCMEMSK